MKQTNNPKKNLIKKLAYLENNLNKFSLVCVITLKGDYAVPLTNGIIENSNSGFILKIFKPNIHIIEMFEWIYSNAIDICFKLKKDEMLIDDVY